MLIKSKFRVKLLFWNHSLFFRVGFEIKWGVLVVTFPQAATDSLQFLWTFRKQSTKADEIPVNFISKMTINKITTSLDSVSRWLSNCPAPHDQCCLCRRKKTDFMSSGKQNHQCSTCKEIYTNPNSSATADIKQQQYWQFSTYWSTATAPSQKQTYHRPHRERDQMETQEQTGVH